MEFFLPKEDKYKENMEFLGKMFSTDFGLDEIIRDTKKGPMIISIPHFKVTYGLAVDWSYFNNLYEGSNLLKVDVVYHNVICCTDYKGTGYLKNHDMTFTDKLKFMRWKEPERYKRNEPETLNKENMQEFC